MSRRGSFRPIHVVFGLLMGGADIIPGVSGGTVALILGIYERLIASIRAVATGLVDALRGRRSDARADLREVEWGLVLPLAAGILTALVIGARIIEPLLERYPVQLYALFFGLIAASLPIPWRRIQERKAVHLGIVLAAAVVAFLLVGIPPRELVDPRLVFVFLAATIAICAMILPGVSGSFLLLVMGMYQPTLLAVNERNLTYILVFAAGAAIGLGAFSKLLHHLLRHHHDGTMAALVGLMVGSLRALWPYQNESRALLPPPSLQSLLMVVLIAAVGFVIVFAVTRLGAIALERPSSERTAPVDSH